ncbi:MAG TPA: right-handed parallel beta-helix repeat-containing protein, partial [Ktedonobacterales bacterium]
MRTQPPHSTPALIAASRGSRRHTRGASILGTMVAIALALAGAGVNLVVSAPAAHAAGGAYTVTNCALYGASGNTGTLGDAYATLLASGGTITFQCATTQTSWDIVVPATTVGSVLTLQNGAGAPAVTLDGNKAVRVFLVNTGGNLTLTGLTVTRGNAGGSGSGGALYVASGASLTLNASTVSASTAGQGGGAIDVAGGTATLNGSTVSGSSANYGGGMYAGGSPGATVSVTDSTFSGNHSTGNGGGIDLGGRGATLTFTTSTLSGNSGAGGGGLAVEGSADKATVTNSTFANNTGSYGGGVYVNGTTSSASISYSTSSGNKASTGGGGLNIGTGGSATLDSSILAGNTQGGACVRSGPLTDNGYNLADDSTCGFSTATHDVVNTTPGLAALANNGGPTQTVALLATSPALDTANPATCPAADERGITRPQGAGCDIGAFELQASGPPPIDATLAIGTPKVVSGTNVYVTTATAFTVTGSGGVGGVASVSYRVYAHGTTPPAYTTVAGTSASFTVSGTDGGYDVQYFATDTSNNQSALDTQYTTLDDTAPAASLTIGQPQTVSGGTITVTSATPLTVGATDPGVGVGTIAYRFYLQGTTAPSYTTVTGTGAGFNLTGANGVYNIDDYAVDSLGNRAAAQSQQVTLGNTTGYTVTDCSQYGAAGVTGTLGDALATLRTVGGTIVFVCSTSQSSWTIVVPATITVPSTLTLQNGTGAPAVTLDGNKAVRIISVSAGGNLTITGLTITRGNAGSGGSGGALYVSSGASLTLNGSTVSASTAGQGGGGIDVAGGTATLNGSTVTGCTATYGGGIYVGGTKGSLVVNNSTLSNNNANNYSAGGAIDIGGTGAGAVITGSTITGNTGIWGGAIGVAGHSTNFQMSNSVMSNNKSLFGGSGGAIYVTSGVDTTLITNTTFSGNTAGNGGAMAVQGSTATATVTNSLFTGNSTNDVFGGGAFFVDNSAVFTLTNSTVTGNAAKGSGGAFYVGGTTNPIAHISYSTITNNTATVANGGGGVLATGTGFISLDSTLLANNPKGGDCAAAAGGTFSDIGYNLADDSSCAFFSGA